MRILAAKMRILESDLASRRLFRRRASYFLDLGDDVDDVDDEDDCDFSCLVMTCLTLVAEILPLLVADLTLTAKIFALIGDDDDLDDLDDDEDGHLTWSCWPPM